MCLQKVNRPISEKVQIPIKHFMIFPKGLDSSRQVKSLKKTTKPLSLQNMFRQTSVIFSWLMYKALEVEYITE